MEHLIMAGLLVLVALSGYFLIGYGLTRPWWRSWEGRALFASSLGWLLVGLGFVVNSVIRDVPDWAWVIVLAVADLGAAFKAWLLHTARRS